MRITQPLNGHVLIRPRKAAVPTPGIDIPDSVDKEKATIGEVVIGNAIPLLNEAPPRRTLVIEAGKTVLFSSLSPRKVTHDGEECLLIHGEDILAVIEE